MTYGEFPKSFDSFIKDTTILTEILAEVILILLFFNVPITNRQKKTIRKMANFLIRDEEIKRKLKEILEMAKPLNDTKLRMRGRAYQLKVHLAKLINDESLRTRGIPHHIEIDLPDSYPPNLIRSMDELSSRLEEGMNDIKNEISRDGKVKDISLTTLGIIPLFTKDDLPVLTGFLESFNIVRKTGQTLIDLFKIISMISERWNEYQNGFN